MIEIENDSEKLADYWRNPAYERRVVIFYDVLGWRNHIVNAGNNSKIIGHLRRLILQHVRTMRLRSNLNIRVSTFSDNVVITQPVCAETVALIAHMAINQIASALKGYLLRGGITIGDVVHDEETVFGPGLNRAYELESKIARFPRFVVDPEIVGELGDLGDLPIEEEGIIFLDPFRLEFVQYLKNGEMAVAKEALRDAGLPYPGNAKLDFESDQVLRLILDSLKPQIRAPIPEEAWGKVAWVYDRIASQIGVPPARSYPRREPTSVAD